MGNYLKIILLTLIFTCISGGYAKAQDETDTSLVYIVIDSVSESHPTPAERLVKPRESRRVVAILLCATLGPFGMHRLYLGTEPQVAAAYTITLGGGFGFVPVVDLMYLLFSKDITRFKNNSRFIMWKRQ